MSKNLKRKKVIKQERLPNLTIFLKTKEVLKEFWPEADFRETDEYLMEQNQESLSDCIWGILTSSQEQFVCETVKLVVLDEEYIDWLNKNGFGETEKHRKEYAGTLSEHDADRLLKKNHFHRDYNLHFLPVSFSEKEDGSALRTVVSDEIRLSKHVFKTIRQHMERVYGRENVWMPDYLLSEEIAVDEMECLRLRGIANAYFEEKQKVTVEKFEEPLLLSENSYGFIPVVIKGSADHAFIHLSDWGNNICNFPEKHAFDFWGAGVEDMANFDNPGIRLAFWFCLINEFHIDDFILEMGCAPEEQVELWP